MNPLHQITRRKFQQHGRSSMFPYLSGVVGDRGAVAANFGRDGHARVKRSGVCFQVSRN